MINPERCYCGDPECRYCFPFSYRKELDEDAEYEILRQQEIDDDKYSRTN